MKIQPNPSGRLSASTDRVGRGAAPGGEGARGARAESRTDGAADGVQISSEARDLQPLDASAAEPTLGAARLREVLDRVSGGFYEKPEVIDTVIQRLRKDL